MRLYLCGGGSGEQIHSAFLDFAKNINKEKPILYIPLAMNQSKYNECYKWFKNELKTVKLTNFEMVKSSYELSKKDLSQYSSIFIGGGNTYKLLSDLKEYENFEKIKNYDGIIFGGSAGAIIFGQNIDSCKLEDSNNVELKDTLGFNYLNNYSLLCHLNEKHLNKNIDYLKEYTKNNKLIYLPEEDVILINKNNIEIIGEKDFILFKDGIYEYHNIMDFNELF